MTNSERLLLYTLPRWAGVTALSIKEPLSDMWLGGEEAGHHSGKPYDAAGHKKLRTELLKDFAWAPSHAAFGAGGSIQTVRDLAAAMAGILQKPVPSASSMLAALLPREELATLSRARLRTAIFHDSPNDPAETKERRLPSMKRAGNKNSSRPNTTKRK